MSIVVRSKADLAGVKVGKGEMPYVIQDNIGTLIAITGRLLARTLDSHIQPYGVRRGQWPLLLNLWAEEGLSQRELSRRVILEEGTIARTLDRMQKDGLIRRARHPSDGREFRILLTAKGKSLRDTLIPQAVGGLAQAIQPLSEGERSALRSILMKMITAMQKDFEK